MANQNRRPSGTQTVRTGSQSRGGGAGAASAKPTSASAAKPASATAKPASAAKGKPTSPAGGGKSASATARPASATAAKGRPANGKPASATAAKGKPATAKPTAATPRIPGWTPRWFPLITLAVSLVGVGLSVYLTIAHLVGAHILACSNHGFIDCAAVTTSPESELFGIFPVAELGLAFYVFMTLINLPWAWQPDWRWLPGRGAITPARRQALALTAWRLRLGSVIVGVLFILYLIYTELITLRTICLFCTYVHITTFVLFIILLAQATFWGSPAKAAPDGASGVAVR